MVWNKTIPTSGTSIASIPNLFLAAWTALENQQEVQHYGYDVALSGRHIQGVTPFLYVNTTANIAALTSPGSGAIAFDTDLGLMKRYDSGASAWKQINLDTIAAVEANLGNSDQTVASADEGTYTIVSLSAETKDHFSNWNTSTYRFTAPTNGYYAIYGQLTFTANAGGMEVRMGLTHYDSSDELQQATITYKYTLDTEPMTIPNAIILYLEASDYVTMILWHGGSSNQTIEGGTHQTFLKVYKIS